MRVLLINPPLDHMLKTQHPEAIEKLAAGHLPPLGLLYVAAYLEKHTPHEIMLLDAIIEGFDHTGVENYIRKTFPDIIGIYSTIFTLIDVLKIAEVTKKIDKDIYVCLGGPLVASYPEEVIEKENIDSIILGEGETAFSKLLNSINNGKSLEEVEGLWFKRNGRTYKNDNTMVISNLDSLPFPARHLIPFKKYYDLISREGIMTTISTSRGCPNNCAFCNRFGIGPYRARSPQNVIGELKKCISMGINEFFMIDDTFTTDRKRVIALCDEILANKLDIRWDIRTRVDAIDEEIIVKLKRAGCSMIRFGVESGTDEILRKLNKGITTEQIKNTFALLRKHQVNYIPYFIIGCPSETENQIMETIKLAIELSPPYVVFSTLLVLPKTELFYRGLEMGLFKNDFWKEYVLNPSKEFKPRFWTENFSESQLDSFLAYAHKRFYRRPSYIFKRILEVRSLREFVRKAKIGSKILWGL